MFKYILPKKIFTRNVNITIGLYLLILLLVYVSQRDLMYFAEQIDAHTPSDYSLQMDVVQSRTSDHVILQHWFAPPKNETYPVLVFFHGNGGHLGHYAPIISQMLDKGYGVMAVEYRGYGTNDGEITETGLYSDGHSAMKWILNRGYSRDNIYLVGLSLGSAISVEMAATYDVAGLVLLAPFTRASDIGKAHYWYLPVSLLIKDRFENDKKIDKIKTPLLVIHGGQDETVSIKYGRKLFKKAQQPKKFIEIERAHHNDLFEKGAFDKIHTFIQSYLEK